MEKGYPIKYAVEELTISSGYKNGYDDIIEGYIVSKCYVTDTNISYYTGMEPRITHEVVFPFRKYEKFKFDLGSGVKYHETPITPRRNASGNASYAQTVDKLFDTFEEAKKEAEIANSNIWKTELMNLSLLDEDWKAKHKRALLEHKTRLGVCSCYETFITEQTKDMQITPMITLSENEEAKLTLKPKKND